MFEDKHPEDIGLLIKCIQNRIEKEINKKLVKFNVTCAQENVLWAIYHGSKKGDVFQKDIERKLELSNPTVTGIVKRLEEKNMIERVCSKEDGRCKSLTLTKSGLDVIHNCIDYGVNHIEKKLLTNMNTSEIEELRRLLKMIINNMEGL